MVGSHKTLLLVAPLKEREVNNPEALEYILITKTKTIAHLKTKRTELDTGLVGIVTTENQYQVAIFGSHHGLDLCQLLRRIELVDAALHGAVGIILDVNQALGSYLWTLYEIGQLVELLATIVGTTWHTDTANILSLIEHRETALTGKCILELYELHTETQIGLITTEALHSLMPCHLLKLRQLYTSNLAEEMTSHFLEEVDNVILIDETHLAVYLCKLWLTVCTKVLITEALGYLEIAVETSHHQELLQCLRALR